jgi:hypothetical protein
MIEMAVPQMSDGIIDRYHAEHVAGLVATAEQAPRSVKFGGLQALLSIVDLPPEGGPVASSSHRVTTPRRLRRLLKQSNF